MSPTLKDLRQSLVFACVDYLITATEGRVEPEKVVSVIAEIVENSGGLIDACRLCGAMPMTTNCNDANCQDDSTITDDLPKGKGDPDFYGYPGQEQDEGDCDD